MRRIIKKPIKEEKGSAFILVLIFLLVGGLVTAPLLSYMSTGLLAGQMHEARMDGLYAADAGVEDALYKIMSNDASLPQNLGESYPYDIADVNGNSVHVEIVLEETINEFLENLLGGDAGVHEDWTAVVDEDLPAGEYTITVSYAGAAANKKIDGVGAWFRGDYTLEELVSGIGGMNDTYPPDVDISEVSPYRGGTAFIWRWPSGHGPEFGTQPGIFDRFLTFKYDPDIIPVLYVGWVEVGSMDIGTVPTAVTFGTYKVIATATDSATGEQTVVVAYPSWISDEEGTHVDILAWEINPQ